MNYLIIGTGSIGSRHAQNIATLDPEAKITLLRSSDEHNEYVENLIKELRITIVHHVTDAISLLPQAVVIANPTHLHVQTGLDILPYCKNLFIEKPLSNTNVKIEELARLAKEKHARILVGYNLRFHPVIKKLKEIVSSESLGKPLYGSARSSSYLPDWRPGRDYKETYSAKKDQGGGVVLDLSHEIDYCYHLFGKPTKVTAMIPPSKILGISSEECADILIWGKILLHIHLDYVTKKAVRTFDLTCEKGIVHADLLTSEITIRHNDGKEEVISLPFDKNQMYLDEMQHFINVIKDEEDSLIPLSEAIDVLKICLEAKKQN
jgi:predicted dehydrogenase